jgi:hypothetical protein
VERCETPRPPFRSISNPKHPKTVVMSLGSSWSALSLAVGLAALGCQGQSGADAPNVSRPDAAEPTPSGGGPSLDASVEQDARALDAAAADADAMVVPLDAAGDGAVSVPLKQFVGLVAAPAPQLDAGVPVAGVAELEAELEVLALGSRAVWFEVLPTSILGLSRLEQRKDVYRDSGVQLLVNVPLDEVMTRPFTAPDEAMTQRYRALIQSILTAPVTPTYLTFGRALDVALERLDEDDAAAVATWLTPLLQYVKETRGLAPTRVGLSGSAAGWRDRSKSFAVLNAVSEVAGVSWLVVGSDGRALPPAEAISDLDALVESVAARELVVFQDLAYPATEEAGSSEAQQRAFFEQFFARLPKHAARVPFVSIAAVNEYPDTVCQSYVGSFGLPSLAAVACRSVGLRRANGDKKPAYDTVAQGLASFSAF